MNTLTTQKAYDVLSKIPSCDWTDDYGVIRRGFDKYLIELAKRYIEEVKASEGEKGRVN